MADKTKYLGCVVHLDGYKSFNHVEKHLEPIMGKNLDGIKFPIPSEFPVKTNKMPFVFLRWLNDLGFNKNLSFTLTETQNYSLYSLMGTHFMVSGDSLRVEIAIRPVKEQIVALSDTDPSYLGPACPTGFRNARLVLVKNDGTPLWFDASDLLDPRTYLIVATTWLRSHYSQEK